MIYYCWACYAGNDRPSGVCVECGSEIAAPVGTSYVELLLWELGHTLPDRQLLAAQILGQRREVAAREPLRALAAESPDPYLAAQALHSLLALDGTRAHRQLLDELSKSGAVPVRAVAAAALEEST